MSASPELGSANQTSPTESLQVLGIGDELAVFDENRLERRKEGVILQVRRRRFGCFKNDLERARTHSRRRAQRALVSVANDAALGAEIVNLCAGVARQEGLRRLQRRLDQVPGERRAADDAVKAFARLVRVQRDDALERARNELGLQEANLRLDRVGPELAIEVLAGAGAACVVLVACRVANRVKVEAVTGHQ